MKRKIKFGIIGCSAIAERSTLPAIINTHLADVKIIGSRSLSKAKRFAKQFSCDNYGDYREVLKRNDVEAVYVSLPVGMHEEWVIKSANAGKHILCEKSATDSYHSAKQMIQACEKNNVRILEALMFRFHPQHREVLKIIQQNSIGNVFSFSGSFLDLRTYSRKDIRYRADLGGGSLNDIGCYPISASRMIFDNEPIGLVSNLKIDKKTKVDVQGSVYLIYPDGEVAFVTFGFNNFFQSTYSLWGDEGTVSVGLAYDIPKNTAGSVYIQTRNKRRLIEVRPVDQFQLMIEEFVQELTHPNSSSFNFERELLNQARVMEAIRRSNAEKQFITINEIN